MGKHKLEIKKKTKFMKVVKQKDEKNQFKGEEK